MWNGLIKFEKYATQVGQLRTMSRSGYGDSVQTAVTTINLLVYQEEEKQQQATPNVTQLVRHFAIIPKDSVVSTGDQLKDVVNHLGEPVLSDARILLVNDYNSWKYGNKFQRVQLDLDLG